MNDPVTETAPDVSIDSMRAMLTATDAVSDEPETPAVPAKAETKPVEESDPSKTKEPAEEAVSVNVQKRIDKAVKAQREAERKAAELEAKLQTQDSTPAKEPVAAVKPDQTGKPVAANFDTYEEYIEKLTDWKQDQRDAARAQADAQAKAKAEQTARVSKWNERETAAKSKFEDYDEAVKDAKVPDTPARPVIHEYLLDSEAGPAIAYHLAKNPEDLARIAALSPVRAVGELGKLEAKLSEDAPQPKTAAAKPLPKPPAVVAGSTPTQIDLNDKRLGISVWQREFRRQLAKDAA